MILLNSVTTLEMQWTIDKVLLGLIVTAYLAGSIPFGLLVGWSKGIDVRKAGSGNIGASNVGRLLGKKYFFLVMFLDLLKSLLPMLAASFVVRSLLSPSAPIDALIYVLWLMVGFSAILGHMFSLFLKLKGGKGVATSTGVMLGLWPYYTLPALVTITMFIVLIWATRYISVGSIGAAITFPLAYLMIAIYHHWMPMTQQSPLLIFAVLISLMVILKHRSNIHRLLARTENRIGRPKASHNEHDPTVETAL